MSNKTVYYELNASAFNWNISDQKSITAWGFNNTLPGPVLKAKKGDTLVVKVKNNLAEPTIVHWHGIRLPAIMDGTGEVQKPILPGEEFEYRFVVPDAGTFWYHSHENETEQMEKGMYGALIVEDDEDPLMDAERIFMIDDMKLAPDHSFIKGGRISRWIERHDGRQGNTLLINGRENPVIEVNAGQMERWRFINSSSARYFKLYLGGRSFKIIGTDGGLLQAPKEESNILLVPGERIDIVPGPFKEGEIFSIESLSYNRTTFVKSKRASFATIKVSSAKPSSAYLPEHLRQIDPLAGQYAPVTRKVKLSVGASFRNGIDFLVNNNLHDMDKPVQVGDLQIWEVSNTSKMDHPFHLHGFFFQVLEINGKAPEYRAWKDTVNLAPQSSVKIAWMPDNRPGKWMYHCHILEHHAAGMMSHFEVVSPAAPNRTSHHHHHYSYSR